MVDIQNHLIYLDEPIINALKMLNNVPDNLTLFVVDHNNKMVGTLTDGDVRRGFIKGCTTSDPVSVFMSTRFRFLSQGKPECF